MGFFGGVGGRWKEDGQKSENEHDPSQVEAPSEERVNVRPSPRRKTALPRLS
jgi:hypothetical protein